MTKAAICRAADRISTCSSAGQAPVMFDQSIDSLSGALAAIGANVSLRATSSTTPVKCLENSSSGSVRSPTAGSWMVALLRLTAFSTTK